MCHQLRNEMEMNHLWVCRRVPSTHCFSGLACHPRRVVRWRAGRSEIPAVGLALNCLVSPPPRASLKTTADDASSAGSREEHVTAVLPRVLATAQLPFLWLMGAHDIRGVITMRSCWI